MMKKELSYRQQQIIDFIRHFLVEKGYPPSIRDILSGCGISSTSVVTYNLRILEREGYIRRQPEVSRGIELVEWSPARRSRVALPRGRDGRRRGAGGSGRA